MAFCRPSPAVRSSIVPILKSQVSASQSERRAVSSIAPSFGSHPSFEKQAGRSRLAQNRRSQDGPSSTLIQSTQARRYAHSSTEHASSSAPHLSRRSLGILILSLTSLTAYLTLPLTPIHADSSPIAPSSASASKTRANLTANSSTQSYPKKKAKEAETKQEEVKSKVEEEKEGEREEGLTQPSGQQLISAKEVEKHNTREDCWVIVEGNVYDVTDFLDQHPGGAGIILQNAGKDATEIFKPLHPPNTLQENLSPSQRLGPIDPTTLTTLPRPLTPDEKRVRAAREDMPPIEAMINLNDFEVLAEKVLSKTAWAYYRSAANGEDSFRENAEAWNRYWFRPRVLRSCLNIDPSSTILGMPTSLPVYVSPAAMAKLGHPLGEVNITRAAGKVGLIQGISANASCSLEEMVEAKKEGQDLIFQIYLNKDRATSEKLLHKVTKLGCSAIMFTVDSAVSGYRELDVRAKGVLESAPSSASDDKHKSAAPAGIAQAISGYQDSNLVWDDINFIRKHTHLPIIVKGIQSVEDVEIAAQHDVAAVILSNHGGRSLNFAPPPIDILYEMRQTKPELFDKLEVYVDGGVKRGTDVVKALCLGAKAVGLGRTVLYANGTYGQEGVEKIYDILRAEVLVAMALLGAHTVDELKPEMVRPRGWMPPGASR